MKTYRLQDQISEPIRLWGPIPEIGEIILVSQQGHGKIISIIKMEYDTYIQIEWQETKIKSGYRFTEERAKLIGG